MREIALQMGKPSIGRCETASLGTAHHGSANSASVLASLATLGSTSMTARISGGSSA
ncbi:hypothetical protein [Streptomyces coeruleorubidus]|uniref:hypothetical protein n=1 Tax=Streptomyces coeruleorubidus TaxID=116188 RepID=UPI00142EF52A|nr:hypothetical protein [Streptomyces coeruleorubidus]GGU13042.1 hypothetical protein GCM10010256_85180 [Streptomyces coeruleorubidus]